MIAEILRLVQLVNQEGERRVALVEEPQLTLLNKFTSIYELALEAIHTHQKVKALIVFNTSKEVLDYDKVSAIQLKNKVTEK
ncbi:hypothetical protein BH23BAC1_BH23BAC1_31760 [soil metagenome]